MNAYENYIAGNECIKKADYLTAIKYFSVSNDSEPHYKTYEKLFLCYYNINEIEKAFDCISKAYSMNCKNDKTALEYAILLFRYKNDRIKAQKILEDILKRNPSYKAAKEFYDSIAENNKDILSQ